MITVTFTELRNHAKKYFDAVDEGETIEVCRHGKPVAVLTPIRERSMERWKRANPLRIEGVELSKAILEERRLSR
ncbi:MAG: type II toxin-antitoxin system prevent-host-death family antitoxin [Planctomycetes bacterium]|nr:type II toxin-antitoxin system prevent-host-death family antitoxin [Planctomycetota bacterium]MBU4400319.1 type II toxin-antitoxin system prevent-host-death family antitoxin [Planctomycetota bacterium]MCG2682599.1 type II toxin-antitoxin system prevent-host-death family antitoxin [Planctomycetales bacterium]